MAPQTRRQAQTTPATLQSDTPSTLVTTNRPQTRGNTGNFRYQNAVFSITAQRPTTTRQRTIAGKGKAPKPPTKAAETRAHKQQEKKRKQRLACNEHEAIANDLAFDDELPHQAEVNQPLHNNPIPSQPLLQNPTATPQQPD
ncbi:hypothetical protein M422DRAFT_259104 [Sphaerobolus stellatus SS14]|uniref:Uncharacterized protein n=1 Tax=Sphaerobolus stellatus (strain SS14) TaxID=990650 RepID=A0A0C9U5C4_SPHS4|nr:hypothetical protein M422DRAFT_259104 [Sphaerobolus stellatus SS14]